MNNEIEKFKTVFQQTLKLIHLYHNHNLKTPSVLKGNLGEFLTYLDLLKKFSNEKLEFFGGSKPSYDILINDKIRIQVKTQIGLGPLQYKNGNFLFEGCPTVKRNLISENKCDYIILVVLYPEASWRSILEVKSYIFEQDDFKYFSTKFCWSGKSKGDYTILNVLKVTGMPPKGIREIIAHYDNETYRKLFRESRDNFNKIGKMLNGNKKL